MDKKIEALIAEWVMRPFKYGAVDCCQFAAAATALIYGVTIKLPIYATERSAFRAVNALGGLSIALQNNGFKRLENPLLAGRGDLVIIKHKNGGLFFEALAVCTGESAHTTGTNGLVAISQNEWLEAWRLNHG